MDIDLKDNAPESSPDDGGLAPETATYSVSTRPVVSYGRADYRAEMADLPRSYGTQTLTLMARDPRNIFAYWDIDWTKAFHDSEPQDRKVHLRLLNAAGGEATTVEIEPTGRELLHQRAKRERDLRW